MGLPELWGSPRSRRKCSEIRVSRGSARTVGRRTGGCCLGRPGKSKPEWNQGSHGPANQEPGRASAEEKSPAFRHGDLLRNCPLLSRFEVLLYPCENGVQASAILEVGKDEGTFATQT